MRPITSLIAVSMVLALAACGEKPADTASAPAAAPAAPSAPTAPTAAPTAAPTSTVAAADKIGIPECDDFLTKYEMCINDKVPADQRGNFAPMMAQWRSSWKTAAATPGAHDTMKATCEQSRDSMRASMKAYGCDF